MSGAAEKQKYKNAEQEETVDQGCRWWIEVIVVLRDELADLVDKQTDANSTKNSAGLQRPTVGHGQWEQYGNEQKQPTPKRMGNVQNIVAKLWESRQLQESACKNDRAGEGDDGEEQILLRPLPPDDRIDLVMVVMHIYFLTMGISLSQHPAIQI
jgi:hypothetical protein